MENELDEKWNRVKEELENLPEKARRAIYWVIKNWDFVIEICKESNMTYEEIETNKKKAKEKEDYVLFVLLHITEMYKNCANFDK